MLRKKIVCVLAVLAAAALTALRVWQYLWIIDIVSGFFTRQSTTIVCLYGVLAAFLLIAAAFTFLGKSDAGAQAAFLHTKLAGYILLLAGFVNIFTSAYTVAGFFMSSAQTPDFNTLVLAVLSIASAMVFLYYGFLLAGSRRPSHRILPLLPALWATIRLLFLFRLSSTVLPISEYLLSLLSLVVMSVYFLYFAFACAGLDTKHSHHWFFLSAVTGVALIVPNALGMLLAASANAFYSLEPIWYLEKVADLSVAALMLCTACCTAFGKKREAGGAQ